MSKPKHRWWGYVRRMIRDYPKLKQISEQIRSQSVTSSPAGMPRSGGIGRVTESIALRQLPCEDQKVLDAVSKAVDMMRTLPSGEEKLKLIKLMYWSPNNQTAKSAAIHLFISEITAKRWHGEFVRLVAKCYGFEDDTQELNICSIILP